MKMFVNLYRHYVKSEIIVISNCLLIKKTLSFSICINSIWHILVANRNTDTHCYWFFSCLHRPVCWLTLKLNQNNNDTPEYSWWTSTIFATFVHSLYCWNFQTVSLMSSQSFPSSWKEKKFRCRIRWKPIRAIRNNVC